MKSTAQSGYLFANEGGAWASFATSDIVVSPDGKLQLGKVGPAFRARGAFFGGPFTALDGPTPWFRVDATTDPLPAGAHVQIFAYTSDGPAPVVALGTDSPFTGWESAPPDSTEFTLTSSPRHSLWIGGLLRSDGNTTAAVRQVRIEYGREGWTSSLPAIYRQDDASRDLLERFLTLNRSRLGGLEDAISDLPLLMDSFAAPDEGYPSWLEWLSSWLSFPLNEHWTDAEKRQYLSEAFALYARRGTIEGLRRYIQIYAGVDASIIEPARAATLWTLGENSSLGFTTMLAPAEISGAVVSSTAVLDRSNLALDGDRGASLFDDVANRFCISVWCSELKRPGALSDLRAVVEREKPAHTVADICLIHPGLRLGISRVGINSIAGDGLPSAQIGKPLSVTALAAEDRECKENGNV